MSKFIFRHSMFCHEQQLCTAHKYGANRVCSAMKNKKGSDKCLDLIM